MHGLLWLLGVYPVPAGTSPMYQLWSGFIPALAVSSLVAAGWRRINCHVEKCMRLARYPVDGTDFRVCHKHHPSDEIDRKGVRHGAVISAWDELRK